MPITSKRMIERIKKLRSEGLSYVEIHRRTGVSRDTARKYSQDVPVAEEPPKDHVDEFVNAQSEQEVEPEAVEQSAADVDVRIDFDVAESAAWKRALNVLLGSTALLVVMLLVANLWK